MTSSTTPTPARAVEHLLVSVKPGAEPAVVARQQSIFPSLARAAWRRGVVTFRMPRGFDPPEDLPQELFFAQAVVRSFGQAAGCTIDARADAAVALAGTGPWDAVHVWHRDRRMIDRPAEAGSAETAAVDTVAAVTDAILRRIRLSSRDRTIEPITRPGDVVVDCVIDSSDRWWIGWHRASTPQTCRPGGEHPAELPPDKVSRAWLKLDEAIATAGLSFKGGERACELGASPGGACQRLLEAGLHVVGVDPAQVDQRVASHPRFEQWRMRARDVKLRAFRDFDWFVVDMNIDPRSTMESLERILGVPGVRPRGVIATLKLPDWSRAAEIPGWLERFRLAGQVPVMVRQLSTGGREVCVVTESRKRATSRRTP